MANQRIKIPRTSDRRIVDLFKELRAQYGLTQVTVSALGFASLGSVNVDDEDAGDFGVLMQLDSALIDTMTTTFNGLSISYHRGGQMAPEQKSPIFDEIALDWNQQKGQLSNSDKLKIVEKINSKLHAFQPGRTIDSGISKEQADLLAIHQSNLERLEKLNEDLIRQGIGYRDSLDEKYNDRIEKLEKDFDGRNEKHEADLEVRQEEIAKKWRDLELRQKQIDDRDNTHVRRELRMAIIEEVKERSAKFVLTKGTQRLRWPVHVVCVLVFVVAVAFSYAYAQQFFSYLETGTVSTLTAVLLSLKSFGFTFLAAAVGIFYLRWLNHWFRQHADAEFRLKQFQLDIDRASWVVETVLEMKAGKEVIPTALLKSLTRNLFEHEAAGTDEDIHPADELASALLGTASDVRIKAGDAAEITFTGKDLKKQMRRKKDMSNKE